MKTIKRLLMVGQPMPKTTWGCATYDGYPCEMTLEKWPVLIPRSLAGWEQKRFTNILLPEHVVTQLRRGI